MEHVQINDLQILKALHDELRQGQRRTENNVARLAFGCLLVVLYLISVVTINWQFVIHGHRLSEHWDSFMMQVISEIILAPAPLVLTVILLAPAYFILKMLRPLIRGIYRKMKWYRKWQEKTSLAFHTYRDELFVNPGILNRYESMLLLVLVGDEAELLKTTCAQWRDAQISRANELIAQIRELVEESILPFEVQQDGYWITVRPNDRMWYESKMVRSPQTERNPT